MTKRLWSNYKKYGETAVEIFTQYNDGTGAPRHFGVFEARLWCSVNKSISLTKLDFDLADKMANSDMVNDAHVGTKTFDDDVAPIIILVGASDDGDLIIDGAHRYVAFANDVRAKGLEDQVEGVPAYFLEPHEWRRFVIPGAIVKALSFDTGN